MKIRDRIYGSYEINSPAIIELINCAPVQRLKKISQMGPPDKYYHLKGYSRYEHSIGVMLLLKHLGANEEEQIAGLLHDVSHTAFSHVVDWVINRGYLEDFQDRQHEKVLLNSEIKHILLKYDYNPVKIAQLKKFLLLDREIPELCADRIDYAIREFPVEVVKRCFNGLTVFNNKIVYKNRQTAQLFAENYLKRQTLHWACFEAGNRYFLFARVLKKALKNKDINFSDFMKTEGSIVQKLENSKDKQIKKILHVLSCKDLSHLPLSQEKALKKFRFVDPYFLENNQLKKLSFEDKKFKIKINHAKKINDAGIRIVSLY